MFVRRSPVRSAPKMIQTMQMVRHVQDAHVGFGSVSVGFRIPVELCGVFAHFQDLGFGEDEAVGVCYAVPRGVYFGAWGQVED